MKWTLHGKAHFEKWTWITHSSLIFNAFKVTVVNRTCQCVDGEILEITFIFPWRFISLEYVIMIELNTARQTSSAVTTPSTTDTTLVLKVFFYDLNIIQLGFYDNSCTVNSDNFIYFFFKPLYYFFFVHRKTKISGFFCYHWWI